MFFLQLPTPPPGSIENWLIPATGIASMALLIKQLFFKKRLAETPYVTKTEFHRELTTVRDKIDARFLALSEKIEHLRTSIEAGLARLDERTKK